MLDTPIIKILNLFLNYILFLILIIIIIYLQVYNFLLYLRIITQNLLLLKPNTIIKNNVINSTFIFFRK